MSCFIKIVHVRQDSEEIYLVHSHTNKQKNKQTKAKNNISNRDVGMYHPCKTTAAKERRETSQD
jgi:hypothetical protein